MGCDLSQGFYKEKLTQTQMGTIRDIFLESGGITKMTFSHSKHTLLVSINFALF